jgi:tRNA nucleotidyltransferase (CCA-adding enzyme)
MTAMGLYALPVDSIAIPDTSPLVQEARGTLNTSADYSRRLTEFFPVYFVAALYELQSLIQRFQLKAYVVGGITRDLLLLHEKRLSVRDVDITVEGDALAFAAFLVENSRNFQLEAQFPEFGTVKVRYKDSLMFDLASTRQEIYPNCGALPVVVNRGVALVDDIIRRDFTVNALAFAVHELGHVLDYCGGIRDIQARKMRVLHPVSFFEDPSRILRALKFCARFNFDLAEETVQLLSRFLDYGGNCYKGGGERIKQELKGFLSVENPTVKSQWVRFFMESGCYRLINMEITFQPDDALLERLGNFPELMQELETALSSYADPDFRFDTYLCFLFSRLSEEEFQKASQRLGLTRNEREFVEQFRKLRNSVASRFGALHEFSSPAEIYDIFHGLHFITVVACLAEVGLEDKRRMRSVIEAFLKYKRKWEKMTLELDGNDLIEMGVPEGKQIGQMLDLLLHAKLAGHVPDRLDEIQYIRNRLTPAQPQEPPNPGLARGEAEADADE